MAINYLSIDHMIVYASLLITLIVGLRAGKGIKTIREYAVGNKMFGTTALVLTYMATNFGGAFMFSTGGLVFSDGIIVTCSLFGFCMAEIIVGLFIAPKAVYFKNCLTMGDLMQQFYGRYAGIVAGLLSLLQAIFIAGLELIAISIVCKSFLGIPASLAIVIGGVILAGYAAHGGIKAVVSTDIVQFITLIMILPITAVIVLHHVGGIQSLVNQLPPEKLAIFSHKKFVYYMVCFLVWGIFPSAMIDPALIQRMLMSNSPAKLRRQYLITAISNPVFQIVGMLIALTAFILYPTIQADDVIPHTLSTVLPIGIKGWAAAGLIGLIMATADSYLHIAGISFVHDIIRPLRRIPIDTYAEKRLAQWSTIVIGLIAIGIGLNTTDIFGLFLEALATTGPILMFPLFTGIIGLKPEKKAFYIAMVITIITWISCNWFLPENYSYLTILISILANGIAFFGTHYWINKGFKMDNRRKVAAAENKGGSADQASR